MDIGFLYKLTDRRTLGLVVKNIADFHESNYLIPKDPEKSSRNHFTLPTYTTLGFSQTNQSWTFSIDNEFIYGRYGTSVNNKAKFWLLRGGAEKRINPYVNIRLGIIIPVIAHTSTLGNIRNDLPNPRAGATLGVGTTYKNFTLDFAIYGDPARSYIEQEIKVKAVTSLTVQF